MEYKELIVQPRSSSLVVYIESYSQGYSSGQMNDGYSSIVGWRPNLILPVYIDDGLFFLSTFSIAGRKAPFFLCRAGQELGIYTLYINIRAEAFLLWSGLCATGIRGPPSGLTGRFISGSSRENKRNQNVVHLKKGKKRNKFLYSLFFCVWLGFGVFVFMFHFFLFYKSILNHFNYRYLIGHGLC